MGSLLSSTLAEIYLQYFEELMIKRWIETTEIIYYKRYVDDIIIFIQNKITEDAVTKHMNSLGQFNVLWKVTWMCDRLLPNLCPAPVQSALCVF